MIKVKQARQGFNVIFLIMIAMSCNQNEQKDKIQLSQSEIKEWDLGRQLFLNNCAYCHLYINKDEIFASYKKRSINGKSSYFQFSKLREIILNSDHASIKKEVEMLDSIELKSIIRFIDISYDTTTVH